MIFLTLFAIPVIFSLVAFLFGRGRINLREFVVAMAAQAVVAGVSVAVIRHQNLADVEILNGRVTAKHRDRVSCGHSYQCNCYTTCMRSGKSTVCTRHCSTCYEHAYDVDWRVDTTVGALKINRVDRQGVMEPPRFTDVVVGEPASREHTYDNYIKAAPGTLFRHSGEGMAAKVPDHPRVYDYYRVQQAVGMSAWGPALAELNADIGASHQANVVVVVTQGEGRDYGEAINQRWLGGKKNDIVAIIGSDAATNTITWTQVVAWTDSELFKVRLRDDLLAVGTLDRDRVLAAIRANLPLYKRKPMKDFEYLMASFTPTTTQWVVSLVVGLVVAALLSLVFYLYDPFNGRR